MRVSGTFCIVFLLLLIAGNAFGQAGLDTLGLTGTMKDTIIVQKLVDQVKILNNKNDYASCTMLLDSAINILTRAGCTACKEMSDVQAMMGRVMINSGNYQKAILALNKALIIRLNTLEPDNISIVKTYTTLSAAYIGVSDVEKSIDCAKKAVLILEKNPAAYQEDQAFAYHRLGISYAYLGDFNNSIIHLNKALEIRKRLFGENHSDVANSYSNIGAHYTSIGEYNKAIEYFKKAADIRIQLYGEDNIYTAWSFHTLGTAYFYTGSYTLAKQYLLKALRSRIRHLGEQHPSIGATYLNLGNTEMNLNSYKESIDYYKKAESILGFKNPEMVVCYDNLARSYLDYGVVDSAFLYFNKAIKTGEEILDSTSTYFISSLIGKGNYYTKTNNLENAIYWYNRALSCMIGSNTDNIESFGDNRMVVKCFFNLSSCYLKIYNKEKKQEAFDKAIEYIEKATSAINFQNKNNLSTGYDHYNTANSNYPIYETALNIELEKKNNTIQHEKLFSYVEQSRATNLRAQIKSSNASNFSGIPDSLLQREHDLRIDITWREKQRQSLLDNGATETDTSSLRISGIIFDLKREYDALKQRFESEFPAYYRLKYDLSTVALRYVQDSLLQPEQALLEYFVGDSSIYLFVVKPDTMIVQQVKRDFPLDDWIEQFRQGLYGYHTADKAKQTSDLYEQRLTQYLEYAPKLYEKLFAPVQEFLPKTVVLVPDGALGYVPFDALLTASPSDPNDFKHYPYLLHQHQFSYTYSATLLQEMRDKKHHHEPTKEFVAFAPFYNGDTTLLASMYQYDDLMRKDLQPLAYSGPEVAAASKLMRGEIVVGQAATEQRFTTIAGQYRMLHLATHGRADNRAGDYAFLAFTEIKDSIENELLYVKDLYNLELNADLVVLSACETAIGKLQRGEGIISLARAFAYAGAKSIVTTLWEVNDRSTSELMRYFYRELRRGKTKDEALRLARKRYFSEQSVGACHPFFWAAFVPVGDMRAVASK